MNYLRFTFLLVVCSCCTSTAAADLHGDSKGFYLGALGARGSMESTSLRQVGKVLTPGPLPDLHIDADGSTDSPSMSMGGVQLGYEWHVRGSMTSGWGLKPAIELEGLYLGKHSLDGEMPIQPRFLGTQYVGVDAKGYAVLATAALKLQTPWSNRLLPYAAVSAGTARVSLSDADSANPSEPGINHFNSDPDASDSAFAWQLKLGLESKVTGRLHLFAEYRRLNINETRYTFGATDYPGEHLPTESWDVRLGALKYDLFSTGFQYRF